MKFEDFIREEIARKTTVNPSLIKSILKTSEQDLKVIKKIELNSVSARKVMSNYYDILRTVLEALALSKGYKIYSHEAFTSFLEFIEEKNVPEQFERFRKIRNRINYYGEEISAEEVKEHIEKIEILITKLKNKYFK